MKKSLILLALLFVYNPSYCELIGEWSFEEEGGLIVKDTSKYKNDGILVNAVFPFITQVTETNVPQRVDGKVGKALSFDGRVKMVYIASTTLFDMQDTLTLEAWVKPQSLTQDKNVTRRIIDKASYLLGCSDKIYFKIWIESEAFELFYPLTENYIDKWCYIVGTYDGATMKLYMNGTLLNECDCEGNIDNYESYVKIGSQWSSNGRFKGLIDEVKIYNSALSEAQVQSNYLKYK